MSELRDLELSGGRRVPAALLSMTFARGGGPGGQHVNKTETKVDLRLDLDGAVDVLGEAGVARVRERLANRLDADGRLQVVSSEHRSRRQNVEAGLARMETLLDAALAVRKRRRRTRPSRGSEERRLAAKKRRGEIKQQRRPPGAD